VPSDKPVLVFTLIHGTFSKGAPWVREDVKATFFRSRLRSALEPAFDVRFEDRFTWGHDGLRRPWDNTLSARRLGAKGLTQYLKDAPTVVGGRRYLVAHSHGGNVALQALRDETARLKVDGLFCLATPFLFSKRAPFSRNLFGFSALTLLLGTLQWSSRLPLVWSIALWTYTIIYWLLFLVILVFTHDETSEKIDQHLMEVDFAGLRSLSPELGTRVWILRVPEDEVGSLMNFSYSIGRSVRWCWQLVNRIGGWFLGAYFLTIYPARFASEQFGLDWPWIDQFTTAFDRLMTPVMLLATVILFAMVVLRLSFAFDSVRWVPVLDTWSKPVPWEGESVELVSLDPHTRGLLRHTKIHGPATAKIADLVRRRFEARVPA